MKRVITYVTFDLLHYGHINLLRRAKALGDYLIVVVSSDEFNWKEKHKKTYFTYEQRKQLLEAIRYVDLVIPENNWQQKRSDMHEFHVDTFVMGDDWKGKFDFLKEEGVDVVDEVPCAVAPTALQRGVPDGLVEVARRLFHLDDVAVAVAARDVARTRREGVQEAVGVFFQRSFVLEIFVGADLLDRLLVEEILAGGERQTSQSRINYSFHSFVQIRR